MNIEKEVIVKRFGWDPVKINIKIVDNNLSAHLDGEILFIDFCKYLLERTSIINTIYNRTCPYKLQITRHKNADKTYSHRTYTLKYLELQQNNLYEKECDIINLYDSNMKVKGNVECFIPDLLLVMKERGYVDNKTESTYIQTRDLDCLNTEFEEALTIKSPFELEQMGYTVPKNYVFKCNC